jgi:ribosomal protein L34E
MDDFSEHIPCSDGRCIGTIDERGVCNICGKPLRGEGKKREESGFDFSERIPCSDGSCVGIINDKGVCNICGRPLRGDQERREQEKRQQERREQEKGQRNEREEKERGDERLVRFFEIFGLKPQATVEELKQAYRDLVNVWHPDRFSNNSRLQQKAEEKLKEINAAYEYIKSSCYKM